MSDQDATINVTSHRGRSQVPTARSSNHSVRSAHSGSLSEDEDGVPLESASDSQSYEYSDEEYDWVHRSKTEVGPSESASSASNNQHIATAPARRRSRREALPNHLVHRPRGAHRGHHQPPSPESVESHEEYVALDPQRRAHYVVPGGQRYPYATSYTSGGYSGGYVPAGQQVVPFSGGTPPYPYPQYQAGHAGAPYYPQAAPPHMAHHAPSPYEVMPPPGAPNYFPYQYGVHHGGGGPPVYQYQHIYSTPPVRNESPAQPAAEPASNKDSERYEELKEMLIKERKDREDREAKEKKDKEDALAKAEQDKKHAEEVAAAAAKAAQEATTEAEKKAAEKAAEDAKKAEEEAAKIKADADAALALALLPPEEKKKPIKFKDAVGRKFSFPFHLCATWEGMEDLIRQAFLHVDVIGPHVAEGHYDLIGPNNEIILPGVWETVIEPDWTITMHMWPMPEPKPEEVVEVPEKKDKGKDKGKGKPAAKKKDKPKVAEGVPPPPPPPPAPPAPPGSGGDSSGKKKKAAGGFSLFGVPKTKAKPKAAAEKKK